MHLTTPPTPNIPASGVSSSHSQPQVSESGRAWNPWPAAVVALGGFAVWMCWSVLTVQMLSAGFPFSIEQLFSLVAIAGMAGATLRIALGFVTLTGGSRNLLMMGALLMMVPVVGISLTLQRDTALWIWQLLALLTGLGGGLFTVCVAQVGAACPHNQQGFTLGTVTGVGHLGITLAQVLLPLGMSIVLWPELSGSPRTLTHTSGTLLGSLPAGSHVWIQNGSYILLLLLMLGCVAVSYRTPAASTPNRGEVNHTGRNFWALALGFATAAFGLWLILPTSSNGAGLQLSRELVLVLVVALTLVLLKLTLAGDKPELAISDTILNNKHAWIVGMLGAASLGSLLGFAAAFPLLLQVVFGYHHEMVDGTLYHTVSANGPSALTYAWMGPLTGILMRPLGGLAAQRLGGARVTHICMLVLTLACAAVAYLLVQAYRAPEPAVYFLPFLLMFLLIFAAAGAGHAAIHQTVLQVFPPKQATWINVWLAAVAAYGVFYIPQVLGEQLAANAPERAMVDFACFYAICFLLNGWFYLRKRGAVFSP